MKKSPCEKDCPHREPGCHSWCESYKSWAEMREKEKETRRNEVQEISSYYRHRDYRVYNEQKHYSKHKAKYHGR